MDYKCQNCEKDFKCEYIYNLHKNRKNPCIIEKECIQLNAIDLFCGCGGMSKGMTDAGINIIAGIDKWDKAITSF